MTKVIAILVLFSLAVSAGQNSVSQSDWLRYDDCTHHWIKWNGKYRGTWFNVHDFYPYAVDCSIEKTEFWFAHHASRPWDTADVYVEIWNGDATAPCTLLNRTQIVAQHGSPVVVDYGSTPVVAGQNFWVLINTELSTGHWPSLYSDSTPGTHSFYSDDLVTWEPWVEGDYLIGVHRTPNALSNSTWGSLKVVFN